MDNVMNLLSAIANNNYRYTEIGSYIVDTCYSLYCGWETAIWKKGQGRMVIVASCENEDEAIQNHKDWCIICLSNPTRAWDIDTETYEIL